MRCPYCHKKISWISKKCPYCVSWLEGDEAWEKRKNDQILVIVIIMVIFFLFYILM